MPSRLPYPVLYLLVGAALTLAVFALPIFGLAVPVVEMLAAAGVAGWIEGQRRRQTGTRHTAQAALLPLVPLFAAVAANRVWYLLQNPHPAPDDGMAFGLVIVALAGASLVFAVATVIVAALVARRSA